jgi:nicotinamide riboside kinase
MAGFKVAVVGTYSSGKTTLVEALMRHYGTLRLLPEHARRVIGVCGVETIRRIETRDYLLVANLLDEAEADRREEPAISDSGLINNLAHEALFFDPAPDRTRTLSDFDHRPYDAVFLCDYADVELVDDGQRLPDPNLRLRLHGLVLNVLRSMNVVPVVLSGTPAVRLSHAIAAIDNLAALPDS